MLFCFVRSGKRAATAKARLEQLSFKNLRSGVLQRGFFDQNIITYSVKIEEKSIDNL